VRIDTVVVNFDELYTLGDEIKCNSICQPTTLPEPGSEVGMECSGLGRSTEYRGPWQFGKVIKFYCKHLIAGVEGY